MNPGEMILPVQSQTDVLLSGVILGAIFAIVLSWIRSEWFHRGTTWSSGAPEGTKTVAFSRRMDVDIVRNCE